MTPRHGAIWVTALALLTVVTAAACAAHRGLPQVAASSGGPMTPQEFQALPSLAPDWRVAYGREASQFGELRVPAGPGPHPVAILVHGGCFKAEYATVRDLAPMADALKVEGIATWSIEDRRLGEPGGGWPGTSPRRRARRRSSPRALADQHKLDLARVVLVGHSAGGHLADGPRSRAASRRAARFTGPIPLPVRGVVDLAGPVDLRANIQGYEALCRDAVITKLLGGTPAEVPERYAHASPATLLPAGIPAGRHHR